MPVRMCGKKERTKCWSSRRAISWYEKVSWTYSIKSDKRGYYRFGPATLDSGDIFGFYRKRVVSERADRLIVYPKVVPLSDLGIPSFHALGDSRSYVPLHEDLSLPSTIREYRRGDPLNRVAWKESAKAQDLRVRTFDPSASVTVMLAVCVETTSRRWEGFIPELLERTVTASASIAAYAFERRHAVGLISNGSIIESTRSMRLRPEPIPLTALADHGGAGDHPAGAAKADGEVPGGGSAELFRTGRRWWLPRLSCRRNWWTRFDR